MEMKIEKQSRNLIKPFVPTPPNLRNYKLSFIDELILGGNVGVVLFFSAPSHKFVSRLEKSLEKTLTRFYPLAGRYVDEIDQTVDCNDQGAEFIHAKVNIKLKDILVSKTDVMFIDEFIPSKIWDIYPVNDRPLLATQVTVFECGGLALGVSVSHKIADAATLCTFINEWAVMNKEEKESEFAGLGVNSSSLFPARGLRPPELPPIGEDMFSKFTRIKLSFSESLISDTKNGTLRCSKVQLVSSIIWKALISTDRAIHDYPRDSILIQPINLREKFASLIPKSSCGNLVSMSVTESTNLETSQEFVDRLSDNVRNTITNLSKANHNTEEGKMMILDSFSYKPDLSSNVIMCTSWCKFSFYEADFGFGKPSWAAPATLPLPLKYSILLVDDAEGNGVEAYVSFLDVNDLSYFKEALDVKVFPA